MRRGAIGKREGEGGGGGTRGGIRFNSDALPRLQRRLARLARRIMHIETDIMPQVMWEKCL